MANRAYLYSVDRLPSAEVNREELKIEAVAEFSYDIPLVYLILVSGSPQRVPSVIWNGVEAIAGNFNEGLSRLLAFLESIPHPEVRRWKEEAHAFLTQERVQQQYFLLEVDEIFWMAGIGEFDWDPDDPIQEVLEYADGIESVLRAKRCSLGGESCEKSTEAIQTEMHSWGLSGFAPVLFHDFSQETEEVTRGRLTREEIQEMAAEMVSGWKKTEEGRIQLEQLKPKATAKSKEPLNFVDYFAYVLVFSLAMLLVASVVSPSTSLIVAITALVLIFLRSESIKRRR